VSTKKENSNTCVYLHKKPNGEVFYVGIGNSKRPYWKYRNNKHWLNIVNKYPNYIIDVIHKNIDWESACSIEKELISKYKRKCDGGVLVNITLGGDGVRGRIVTKEQKDILREKSKGNKNCLGFKHNEVTRKNMSLSHIGNKIDLETRIKMSNIHKGRVGRESDRLNVMKAHIILRGRKQSQEEKDKRAEKLFKKIIVNEITYNSIKECTKILKISRSCLYKRLKSKDFKNYNYIK
jgi:hypothetical protein